MVKEVKIDKSRIRFNPKTDEYFVALDDNPVAIGTIFGTIVYLDNTGYDFDWVKEQVIRRLQGK